jgi:hypothetical protein
MDSLNIISAESLPASINWINAIVGIFYGITIIYLLLSERIQKLIQGFKKKILSIKIDGVIIPIKCDSLFINAELSLKALEMESGDIRTRSRNNFRLIIFSTFNKNKEVEKFITDKNIYFKEIYFFIPKTKEEIRMLILDVKVLGNKVEMWMTSQKPIEHIPIGANLSIKYQQDDSFKSFLAKELLELEEKDWRRIYREKIKDVIDREKIL